jgi:TolB protein
MSRTLLRIAAPIASLLLAACTGLGTVGSAVRLLTAEPAGTVLIGRSGNLWIIEGGKLRQFTSGGTWRQPRWSPDGSQFAYVYRAQNFSEIFLINRDGTDPKRLTSSQSNVLQDNDWAFNPAWSPDGKRIAFTSDTSSYNPMLWVMEADGTGKRQLVTSANGMDGIESPAWSPDGSTLLFVGFRSGIGQVYRLDLQSGEITPVTATSQGALDPTWSPGGQHIAYVGREADQTAVHVIGADGGNDARVASATSVRAPSWSPDGKQIAFLSADSGHFELYLVGIDTTASPVRASDERQVTGDLDADATSGIAWTR